MTRKPGAILKADDLETSPEYHFRHPLNPNSDIWLRSLGDAVGLERTAVMIGRVPPGRESFVYHSHERDEEFLYVLSGRGRLEIDEEIKEIGPGDFIGFPTPSVAHHLTNPFDEELVYIMGGEHSGSDMAQFPRLGKKSVKIGQVFFFIDDDAFKPFDWQAAFPDGIPPVLLPKADAGPSELADTIITTVLDMAGDNAANIDRREITDAVQSLLSTWDSRPGIIGT